MKGLLLKDFYIIRDNLLIIAITFIAVGSGMAFLVSPWVLIVIASVILSNLAASTIINDNTSQWSKFAATLPVRKQQVISSKYILYLLLCLCGIIAGIIISSGLAIIRQEFEMESIFLYFNVGLIVSLISGSVMIPCNFIFREEKSVLSMILSYIATSVLFVAYILIANSFIDVKNNLLLVCGIGSIVGIVTYFISWMVARKHLPYGTI